MRGINQYAITRIREMIRRYKFTGDIKRDMTGLIWLLERNEIEAERAIDEARQMAIRNPEFWGDMIGRPDDDYFDDDDEDEDDGEDKDNNNNAAVAK